MNGLLCLAKKGDDAFVNTGYDNWKKAHEKFAQHAQSGPHKEAVLKIELIYTARECSCTP